jgi:hypothetical protein
MLISQVQSGWTTFLFFFLVFFLFSIRPMRSWFFVFIFLTGFCSVRVVIYRLRVLKEKGPVYQISLIYDINHMVWKGYM